MIGIVFVGDGTPYDPSGPRPAFTDEEYAAWVLYEHGQADADLLTEMYKAIAGRDGWRRQITTGYTQHAICRRNGVTCIVFRFNDETGWRWQVWRDGTHRAVRSAREPAAATADEAVRLADELAAKVTRRHAASGALPSGSSVAPGNYPKKAEVIAP